MNYWKCPKCSWVKETKDDLKITFCKCCLTIMEKYSYENYFIMEVKNG